MKVYLERLQQPEVGITVVDCPQTLLNLFPMTQHQPAAPFSVLMVDGSIPPQGEVVVDPARLSAVIVGRPGYALLVTPSQGAAELAQPGALPTALFGGPLAMQARPLKLQPAAAATRGDEEFLAEAEAKIPDPDLREGLGFLVGRIREMQPRGFLCPRNQRFRPGQRFVNYPDNFVGFTLHSPKKPVTVHVRRSRVARQSGFPLAPDRRPFVRFPLRDGDDALAALPLIEASWLRSGRA